MMKKAKEFHDFRLRKLTIDEFITKFTSLLCVDSVGPANMSRVLPSKKSQLDLRPFGVGVPIVGSKAMP